jgi:hypothetical protein
VAQPKRWRRARNPNVGTRWNTPMNNFIWERDHGKDVELWQGDVNLATVSPHGSEFKWSIHVQQHVNGVASSVEEAKAAVKAALEEKK